MVLGAVLILGDEIGWRGFLMPRLQVLTTRRKAAVATGFLHGAFHLPVLLLTTTYDEVGNRLIVVATHPARCVRERADDELPRREGCRVRQQFGQGASRTGREDDVLRRIWFTRHEACARDAAA